MPSSLLLAEFCEYYAQLGLYSFPIWNGRKVPAKGSHGHKDATRDVNEFLALTRLFTDRYASAEMGIALRMGDPLVEGGFAVCVDVDEKNDKSGSISLADNNLLLTETLAASTRSGGMHYIYRAPHPLRTNNNWLPGVDIKGAGGWICVAPTSGYSWAEEPKVAAINEAPAWLIQHCLPGRKNKSVEIEGVVSREMVLCPVHENEGSRPSLQVTHLEDGGTLYHCFGGCPLSDVMVAMGDEDYELANRLMEDWGA